MSADYMQLTDAELAELAAGSWLDDPPPAALALLGRLTELADKMPPTPAYLRGPPTYARSPERSTPRTRTPPSVTDGAQATTDTRRSQP